MESGWMSAKVNRAWVPACGEPPNDVGPALSAARMGLVVAAFAVALGGCARDPVPLSGSGPQRPRLSFEAARARCGASVAESDAVKRCMRAQGWAYRLPWQ